MTAQSAKVRSLFEATSELGDVESINDLRDYALLLARHPGGRNNLVVRRRTRQRDQELFHAQTTIIPPVAAIFRK